MTLALPAAALVFFSILAFWKFNALLFMFAAGASLMVGLQWFDVYGTSTGLTMSLLLIAYAFVCLGFAYTCLFWRGELEEK